MRFQLLFLNSISSNKFFVFDDSFDDSFEIMSTSRKPNEISVTIRIVMKNFHDNKHFQRLIGWLNYGKELADWIDVISSVIDHLHKIQFKL